MHILCPLLALVAHSSPSRATSVATTSILRGDSRGIIAAEPSLSADAGEQRTHQDEVDALDGDVLPRPHRTNSHLFEFSGSCTDADYGASPLYVSPNGNDGSKTNGWGLSTGKPFRTIQHAVDNREGCQTIYVMEGTYPNSYYGQSLDHNNRVVNLDGVSDLKILADPDAGSMPVLEFDGPGGILGGSASDPISNVEIAGLEIRGPNESISYADAMAGRLLKKTHFSGRGIAIRAGHHIYIHDMKVHHCPGSGIRVNKGDYITIADSLVYSNTWWTSSAESAVVLAESVSVDDDEGIKMRLVNNTVYDNVNKIPYYNTRYAWDYSPIGSYNCALYVACKQELVRGCPWECRYGKKTQDYIIDGMGVYVTRNKDTYLHGQMELADNTAFGNGINGVAFHRTDRGIVRRNTVYGNGIVPREEHLEDVSEDWHVGLNRGRQPYSGIVLNNAEGVELWSNNVSARYDDDYAFKIEADNSPPPLAAGGNNKVCRGLVDSNLDDVVSEVTNPTVCGLSPLTTAQPSASPTSAPMTVAPSKAPTRSPTQVSTTPQPSASQTNAPMTAPATLAPTSGPTRVNDLALLSPFSGAETPATADQVTSPTARPFPNPPNSVPANENQLSPSSAVPMDIPTSIPSTSFPVVDTVSAVPAAETSSQVDAFSRASFAPTFNFAMHFIALCLVVFL